MTQSNNERRTVKIGITGTHSTGKSTFAEALAEELTDLGLKVTRIGELARKARDKGFPILTEHTIDSTMWIIAECMRLEAEATLAYDVIIVDRPVPDAIAYLDAALEVSGRSLDPRRLATLRSTATAHAREYDLLVVTSLEKSIPLGPDRDQNERFREAAGFHIAALCADLDNPTLVLTSTNGAQVQVAARETVLAGISIAK